MAIIFSLCLITNKASADASLCVKPILSAERKYAIPEQLLTAISHVESGRFDRSQKAFFAWPWTVNAEGKGSFFQSKKEAMEFVRKLQSRGVRSIDVGCMQINLRHHPDAFNSLEEAFDPELNVDYAARFLSGLYRENKSWIVAAAHYHSQTPFFGNQYRAKVVARLNDLRQKSKGNETAGTQIANARQADLPTLLSSNRYEPDVRNAKNIFEADAARKAAVMAEWEERQRRLALKKRAAYSNAGRIKPLQIAAN